MKATGHKVYYPEKQILAIVKSLQPVTDEEICSKYNERYKQVLDFKELRDRLERMKELERIGTIMIGEGTKGIWQVKEE
jgi:hypothetical protein